jgi:predicted O-methyltransferase YrrM
MGKDMGVNDPKTWDKSIVDNYTTKLNMQRATPAERWLMEATAKLPGTMNPMKGVENQPKKFMEVEIGEAHLITMLTRILSRQTDRPMKALDIGTYTGHSAGAMARGMEKSGKVITVDISDQYKAVAEEYWRREKVLDRIESHIIPTDGQGRGGAHKLIDDLVARKENHGTFDIIFIDAEKTGYEHYYNQALTLLRPGGMIVLDNALQSGRVPLVDAGREEFREPNIDVPHALNRRIMHDPRVEPVLSSEADGIMIVEKLGFARHKSLSETGDRGR